MLCIAYKFQFPSLTQKSTETKKDKQDQNTVSYFFFESSFTFLDFRLQATVFPDKYIYIDRLVMWACKCYSSYLLAGFEAFVAHKYVLSQPSLPFFAYHLMHGKFGILPEYDHTNL